MSRGIEFPLFPMGCKSLLSRFLTPEIFNRLKHRQTDNGFTLEQVINSGLENEDSGVGVYAGDEASYSTFAELFDPVIADYHGFAKDDIHTSDFNPELLKAPNPDLKCEYIVSTRIRVGRNLAGFPLGPAINTKQREQIETTVSEVLAGLKDEFTGNYYPLASLSETDRLQLIDDHFLFKAGDRFLAAAGLNRDWPRARGIFHNQAKTFLVWVNEEDQLRLISMQQGGDINQAFTRLANALTQIGDQLKFSHNPHLGYLSSCPTNLGTAMRASAHMKLPRLAADMDRFKSITDRHDLQIRGIHGEHSASENAVFDISNRRRLGVTEVECVQGLYDGVCALIAAERG